MNVKGILLFSGGVVIGAAGGVIGATLYWKKRIQKFVDREVESVKEFYANNNISEFVNVGVDIPEKDLNQIAKNPSGEISGVNVKARRPGKPEYVDYNKYYISANSDPAESIAPSEEDDDEEIRNILDGQEATRKMKKPPRIISHEEYGLRPELDKIELYFYAGDSVLANEEGEIVTDEDVLIGDALTKYGFNENDESVIFVRNESVGADYEITKTFSRYSDVY